MKESYAQRLNEITSLTEIDEVQDEFAILDRAGRVQIPRDVLEQLGVEGNKVRMEVRDGELVIRKADK